MLKVEAHADVHALEFPFEQQEAVCNACFFYFFAAVAEAAVLGGVGYKAARRADVDGAAVAALLQAIQQERGRTVSQ